MSFMATPSMAAEAPSTAVIYRFNRLESTHKTLQRLAIEGALHGTAVTARSQSAGRGRHNRSWQSAEGNLYVSVLWLPSAPKQNRTTLPLVAALGVHDALKEQLSILPVREHAPCPTLQVKWPNDLLLDGAKLGGILLVPAGDGVSVGIGINCAHHPDDTPYPATSLQAHGVWNKSPEKLLNPLMKKLEQRFQQWQTYGFEAMHTAWDAASLPKGSPIILRLPDDVKAGEYGGIDAQGALCLKQADGSMLTITAGDVFPANVSPAALHQDSTLTSKELADAAGD